MLLAPFLASYILLFLSLPLASFLMPFLLLVPIICSWLHKGEFTQGGPQSSLLKAPLQLIWSTLRFQSITLAQSNYPLSFLRNQGTRTQPTLAGHCPMPSFSTSAPSCAQTILPMSVEESTIYVGERLLS